MLAQALQVGSQTPQPQPSHGGGNTVLFLAAAVVLALGGVIYKRHQRRKREEYENNVKTLAPLAFAVVLVSYLGYSCPSKVLETEHLAPSGYFFGSRKPLEAVNLDFSSYHSRLIAGVAASATLAALTLVYGHFRRRTRAKRPHAHGHKHRSSSFSPRVREKKLRPIWFRPANPHFPFSAEPGPPPEEVVASERE